MTKKYWLMKSEPDAFSIEDLKSMPKKTDHWDGVRNYQARNFMRDEMKKGDLILFYHSNAKDLTGAVGVAEVVKEGYPDHTAWDKKSKYFDAKSDPEKPRWFMVDVRWKKDFKRVVTLSEMREHKALKDMKLLQKGNRLSILPVSSKEFKYIEKLGTARSS